MPCSCAAGEGGWAASVQPTAANIFSRHLDDQPHPAELLWHAAGMTKTPFARPPRPSLPSNGFKRVMRTNGPSLCFAFRSALRVNACACPSGAWRHENVSPNSGVQIGGFNVIMCCTGAWKASPAQAEAGGGRSYSSALLHSIRHSYAATERVLASATCAGGSACLA